MSAPYPAPPASLLLGRPERSGDVAASAGALRGRRVLVTGAAGSVGWPLAHTLARSGLAQLVLVDHHEHSLFSLERALSAAAPESSTTYELADVRDARRTRALFQQVRPEVVFHLAAAKHVPYGERFPRNVIEANVLTTAVLLDLAAEVETARVVYPSSDKSVEPPSLYGATKRLCEALVQGWAAAGHGGVVVRFVNILGTRGSVIETFTQQVLAGSPLSVTDERMTRYWISMDEALWALLEAAGRAAPADVVMPDCGEPVPVVETARRLGAWYCPQQQPYPLRLSGIRPGERLHEVLLSRNEWLEDGPSLGLRTVRSRRDPARLAGVPTVLAEVQALLERDPGRAQAVVLAAADQLQ